MSEINNEADFRKTLESLDNLKQRQVAAAFVEQAENNQREDQKTERNKPG